MEKKLTAAEAKKLTKDSSFIEGVIYHNIQKAAMEGKHVYTFNYVCEEASKIRDIVNKLTVDGYQVGINESADPDPVTQLPVGTIIII